MESQFSSTLGDYLQQTQLESQLESSLDFDKADLAEQAKQLAREQLKDVVDTAIAGGQVLYEGSKFATSLGKYLSAGQEETTSPVSSGLLAQAQEANVLAQQAKSSALEGVPAEEQATSSISELAPVTSFRTPEQMAELEPATEEATTTAETVGSTVTKSLGSEVGETLGEVAPELAEASALPVVGEGLAVGVGLFALGEGIYDWVTGRRDEAPQVPQTLQNIAPEMPTFQYGI